MITHVPKMSEDTHPVTGGGTDCRVLAHSVHQTELLTALRPSKVNFSGGAGADDDARAEDVPTP